MAARLPRLAFLRSTALRWVLLGLYTLVVLYFFWGVLLGTSEREKYGALTAFALILASQVLFVFSLGTRDLQLPVPSDHRRFWPALLTGGLVAVLATCLLTTLHELSNSMWFPASLFYVLISILAWVGTSLVVYQWCEKAPRFQALKRLTGYLLFGSLLELIVGIPANMVVSRRNGWLEGTYIEIGIVASTCILLWAFGPGIAILFLAPKHERETEGAAGGGPIKNAPLKRWNFSLGSLAVLVLLIGSVMAVLAIHRVPYADPTMMLSRPEAWCMMVLSVWFAVRLFKRLRRWEKEE